MPLHTKRIKDLPISTRPLERLIQQGAQNLATEELIALLLGTGTKKYNVLRLAKQILIKLPEPALPQASLTILKKLDGVGSMKAARVLAAIELGKRLFSRELKHMRTIMTIEDILEEVREVIYKKQEHVIVFYINARHELLKKEIIGIGSLNTLRLEPKEIFAPAFITPCATIAIVHNHPSGDVTPSEDDIIFTQQIHKAGELLGIPLFDHIIVGERGYYSFREGPKAIKGVKDNVLRGQDRT